MPLISISSILFLTLFSRSEGVYDEFGEFVFQEYLRWNYTPTNPNCIIPNGRSPCQDIRICNFAAVSLATGGWPTLCGWVGKGVPKVCCAFPLILGSSLLKKVDAEKAKNRACGTHFLADNLSKTEKKFMEIATSLPTINISAPERFDPPLDLSPHEMIPPPFHSNTRQGEFPWMVSVQENGFHKCGGALISMKHVLTAAWCVEKRKEHYSINVGNLFADTGYPIDVAKISNYPVLACRPHCEKLALLTLEQEILTPRIPHICTPDPGMDEDIQGKHVTLLRWGTTTAQDGRSRQWLCVTEGMRIVPLEKCKELGVYGNDAIPPKMMADYACAEITKSLQNECESGAGGLLMLKDSLKRETYNSSTPWVLIAVEFLKNMTRCYTEHSQYILLARVSSYMNWIGRNVGEYLHPTASTTPPRPL